MRPVRFVALSEDGQAFVLADEVGRLLALPLDDRVHAAMHTERATTVSSGASPASGADESNVLSPRDIQARIRAGESPDDVARIAGVPVDRVLRYAGPVLQERAMLAQHARRTRLKGSDKGQALADVVDARLAQHGVDAEKISWDAYRRDDGTWRIVATWPSGKATAQAIWELDKARQLVSSHDDMANYLCAERPMPILGQDPAPDRGGHGIPAPNRGDTSRGDMSRGHDPIRPAPDAPPRRDREPVSGGRGLGSPVDPIRSGRDALLASLERPLGASAPPPRAQPTRGRGAFDDDPDRPMEVPAVPSLAVLRPRRAGQIAPDDTDDKPRKRLPSWDDVLFGTGPAARETS